MKTIWKILTHILIFLHGAWVAVLALGAFIQYLIPAYRPFQLAAIAATVALQRSGRGDCPLTLAENVLRARYDPASRYTGSCIEHYTRRMGFAVPRKVVSALTGAILVASLAPLVI